MTRHYINYEDKKYEIHEPSVKSWKKLYSQQGVKDEYQLALSLISSATDIPIEEVKKIDYGQVLLVSAELMNFYSNMDTKFTEVFEFNDKKYRFIDLPTISFGLYVDLDTYLSKSELEKINRLNYYMALLYCEEGVDPNDLDARKKRTEDFEDLPIKYYLGAHGFFLSLSKISKKSMKDFLIIQMGKILRVITNRNRRSTRSGGGIQVLVNWLKTTLQRLKKLQGNLSRWLSTIYRT